MCTRRIFRSGHHCHRLLGALLDLFQRSPSTMPKDIQSFDEYMTLVRDASLQQLNVCSSLQAARRTANELVLLNVFRACDASPWASMLVRSTVIVSSSFVSVRLDRLVLATNACSHPLPSVSPTPSLNDDRLALRFEGYPDHLPCRLTVSQYTLIEKEHSSFGFYNVNTDEQEEILAHAYAPIHSLPRTSTCQILGSCWPLETFCVGLISHLMVAPFLKIYRNGILVASEITPVRLNVRLFRLFSLSTFLCTKLTFFDVFFWSPLIGCP